MTNESTTTMEIRRGGVQIQTMEGLQRFAKMAAASGYFESARDVAQAAVKVQYGLELGLSPIAAMQGVYVIKGRLSLSAASVAALIKQSDRYRYKGKSTEKLATVELFERWGDKWEALGEVSFSWAEAERAKLTKSDNWQKYPAAMLWARALTKAARMHCPDIFNGAVYTPDEMGGDAPEPVYVDDAVTVTVEPVTEVTQDSKSPRGGSPGEASTGPVTSVTSALPTGEDAQRFSEAVTESIGRDLKAAVASAEAAGLGKGKAEPAEDFAEDIKKRAQEKAKSAAVYERQASQLAEFLVFVKGSEDPLKYWRGAREAHEGDWEPWAFAALHAYIGAEIAAQGDGDITEVDPEALETATNILADYGPGGPA